MQVLIINLDRARERLAFQQAQMRALGLSFTRIAALDADHLPDLGEAYWNGWERPIRPAERACLLSHRHIWETIAAGADPVLVLEDDAVLSDKVPALLEALRHRSDLDHVTLETRSRKNLSLAPASPICHCAGSTRIVRGRRPIFSGQREPPSFSSAVPSTVPLPMR